MHINSYRNDILVPWKWLLNLLQVQSAIAHGQT